MALRSMTVHRYEEIRRRLAEGRSLREIARALGCSRRKFPQYREASVTAREFEPGERVEVDYAGDPIEWVDIKSGEVRKAWVFVAGLGFSQLLYAWAAEERDRSPTREAAPEPANVARTE